MIIIIIIKPNLKNIIQDKQTKHFTKNRLIEEEEEEEEEIIVYCCFCFHITMII